MSIAAELQKILSEHLGVEEDEVAGIADRFITFRELPMQDLFDGPSDLRVLDTLGQALAQLDTRNLDRLSASARRRLRVRLRWGPDEEGLDWIDFNVNHEERFVDLFQQITEHSGLLRDVIKAVRADIEISPYTRKSLGRLKEDRLRVTQLAQVLWNRRRSEKLGVDLPETHPFANFLEELFWLFEVDSSPREAYRALVRQGLHT